jgi:hypothetical protein
VWSAATRKVNIDLTRTVGVHRRHTVVIKARFAELRRNQDTFLLLVEARDNKGPHVLNGRRGDAAEATRNVPSRAAAAVSVDCRAPIGRFTTLPTQPSSGCLARVCASPGGCRCRQPASPLEDTTTAPTLMTRGQRGRLAWLVDPRAQKLTSRQAASYQGQVPRPPSKCSESECIEAQPPDRLDLHDVKARG